MQILSQLDSRWGSKPIGQTEVLIRDKGCTITCISMASDYFECFQNPGWMAKYLQFTVKNSSVGEAKIIWQSIEKVSCFKFEFRYFYYNEQACIKAIKNPRKVCLLEIKKSHWVLALNKIPGGYWVADPWGGKKRIALASSVSGSAVLIK
jgi:hypothetical protein